MKRPIRTMAAAGALALAAIVSPALAQSDTCAIAKTRDAEGYRNAGIAYRDGDGVVQDYARAFACYEKAFGMGDAFATGEIAWFYRDGKGVAQDSVRAREWIEMAANMGDPWAMNELGISLHNEGWTNRAHNFFQRAALLGSAGAMRNLGNFYRDGVNGPPDMALARTWYERAAVRGDKIAVERLKQLDPNAAEPPLTALALNGACPEAKTKDAKGYRNAAIDFRDNDYGKKDLVRARVCYEQAAALGDAYAMGEIGWFFRDGKGVDKDADRALLWIRRASDHGDPWAMNEMGNYFESGKMVPRDYARSRGLFERSAAAGNYNAMRNLGLVYRDGLGVPVDKALARSWFERAAAKGDKIAIDELWPVQAKVAGAPPDRPSVPLQTAHIHEYIEFYRPRISPRQLDARETLILPGLVIAYKNHRRLSDLLKLFVLGESGDKAAMLGVIEALGRGTPAEFDGVYVGGSVSSALRAQWAGHYWQMHGADRLAAKALDDCSGASQHYDCGVRWSYSESSKTWGGTTLGEYAAGKKGTPALGVTFYPVDGNHAWRQKRFTELLDYAADRWYGTNSNGEFGSNLGTFARAFIKDFAERQGGQAEFNAALERYKQSRIAMARHSAEVMARQRKMDKEKFAIFERTGFAPSGVNMEWVAASLGDAYLVRYAARAKIIDRANIERICAAGSPHCASQFEASELRIAAAEAAAQRTRANANSGLFGSGPASSALVSVRTYDRQGNYTGTSTMSQTEADTRRKSQ